MTWIHTCPKIKNKLGIHVESPVFDGASEKEIKDLLNKAGLPESPPLILQLSSAAGDEKNRHHVLGDRGQELLPGLLLFRFEVFLILLFQLPGRGVQNIVLKG